MTKFICFTDTSGNTIIVEMTGLVVETCKGEDQISNMIRIKNTEICRYMKFDSSAKRDKVFSKLNTKLKDKDDRVIYI